MVWPDNLLLRELGAVLVYKDSSQNFRPLFLSLFLSPWGKFLAKPWQELVGKTLLNIGNQHTSRRSFWIKLFFGMYFPFFHFFSCALLI